MDRDGVGESLHGTESAVKTKKYEVVDGGGTALTPGQVVHVDVYGKEDGVYWVRPEGPKDPLVSLSLKTQERMQREGRACALVRLWQSMEFEWTQRARQQREGWVTTGVLLVWLRDGGLRIVREQSDLHGLGTADVTETEGIGRPFVWTLKLDRTIVSRYARVTFSEVEDGWRTGFRHALGRKVETWGDLSAATGVARDVVEAEVRRVVPSYARVLS